MAVVPEAARAVEVASDAQPGRRYAAAHVRVVARRPATGRGSAGGGRPSSARDRVSLAGVEGDERSRATLDGVAAAADHRLSLDHDDPARSRTWWSRSACPASSRIAIARAPSSVVSTAGSIVPPGASISVSDHDFTSQPYRGRRGGGNRARPYTRGRAARRRPALARTRWGRTATSCGPSAAPRRRWWSIRAAPRRRSVLRLGDARSTVRGDSRHARALRPRPRPRRPRGGRPARPSMRRRPSAPCSSSPAAFAPPGLGIRPATPDVLLAGGETARAGGHRLRRARRPGPLARPSGVPRRRSPALG